MSEKAVTKRTETNVTTIEPSELIRTAVEQGYRVARNLRFPQYVVLSNGAVISEVKKRARLLRGGPVGRYAGVTLLDEAGIPRPIYRHQLVAETFYGPAPAGHECRHLDGDPLNNDLSNIRYGTRSQNMRDKELHGTATQGERHPMAKLTDREVVIMRGLSDVGVEPRLLMKCFNVSRMTVWRIVNRKLWAHI